jgi:hypothetical protein
MIPTNPLFLHVHDFLKCRSFYAYKPDFLK